MTFQAEEFEAADNEIRDCLTLTNPTSFFLLAGAGSGKTRSLTKALEYILEQHKQKLRLNNKRVAVITYTNKACEEIKHRIKFDALIEVTTIHSFAWKLIEDFTVDIKFWLERDLKEDIADLKSKQIKGKESKASNDRVRSIENKEKRLIDLPSVKKFTYNPNGREFGKESLEHSQVIKRANTKSCVWH